MSLFLDQINAGETLSEIEMIEAMNLIMEGKASEEELLNFLSKLAERGETVDEITGAAKVLREKATMIKAPYGAIDCCGTGGDASGTYNISTTVAIVAAACGVPVAKHGNRASSSKSGAADVLEALGTNLDLPIEALEKSLETLHFAFLMAPHHHKAVKHVAEARKTLGTRTIFNLLGPLANPAGTRHQLIGVFAKKWVLPMAQVLKNLGTKSAWVVHGSDGLDEITITGPTDIAVLDENGHITEKHVAPADFGLNLGMAKDLKGGSAEENATALRAVLEGQHGAYRDIVLANTSAVLNIHGSSKSLVEGVEKAAEAIDSGLALQTLKDYIAFTRGEIGP